MFKSVGGGGVGSALLTVVISCIHVHPVLLSTWCAGACLHMPCVCLLQPDSVPVLFVVFHSL